MTRGVHRLVLVALRLRAVGGPWSDPEQARAPSTTRRRCPVKLGAPVTTPQTTTNTRPDRTKWDIIINHTRISHLLNYYHRSWLTQYGPTACSLNAWAGPEGLTRAPASADRPRALPRRH